MAAAAYEAIEVPNTTFDRRIGTEDHALQDRIAIFQANRAINPTFDIASCFQKACSKLIEDCKNEVPGSTFIAAFVNAGKLHTMNMGDSGLILMTASSTGASLSLELLTTRHKQNTRIKPVYKEESGEVIEGSDFEGILLTRGLGDKNFQYEGSAFEANYDYDVATLDPSVTQYLIGFSDGFADFLRVDPFLNEEDYKKALIDALYDKIEIILRNRNQIDTDFVMTYIINMLKREMLEKRCPREGVDDQSLFGVSIREGILASLADGHGEGIDADATAIKAIDAFPNLLASRLDINFEPLYRTDEVEVSNKRELIREAQIRMEKSRGFSSSPYLVINSSCIRIKELVLDILKNYIHFNKDHTTIANVFYHKHGAEGLKEMQNYYNALSDKLHDIHTKSQDAAITFMLEDLKKHKESLTSYHLHSRANYINAAILILEELSAGIEFESIEKDIKNMDNLLRRASFGGPTSPSRS